MMVILVAQTFLVVSVAHKAIDYITVRPETAHLYKFKSSRHLAL